MGKTLSQKRKICFVCLGNIVRSPLAENMFHHLVKQAGLEDHYEVHSAGTGSWHIGEPPDSRMVRVAARRGLIYSGQACQVRPDDLETCDLVIAMDRENKASLLRMARTPEQKEKIHLLREFDSDGSPNADVPDPYYGGIDGFEDVYDIVERSVRGLLESLEHDSE